MNDLVLVIIDDEPKARKGLKEYINLILPKNKFEFHLCSSVSEGTEAIEKFFPDLVFLDIEMPEATGFELFNKIDKNSFEVVFVTAFSEYLEKSVNEIGCFGYLNKPLERDKLVRIFERFEEKKINKKYLKFINATHSKREMIALNDIIYCKADDNCCHLFMKNGTTKYFLTKTLKQLEKELPTSDFYKVHRSFIVNVNHVSYYEKGTNMLGLNHNNLDWQQKIPVSDSNKEKIKALFL